jgi:DNA-binding transcriptional MocR family regulator
MATFDAGTGRVISLGSFSKILAPGLRLGWIHARPDRIEALARHGALASGGGLTPIVSALVHETITNRFLDRHLDRLREVYRRRAAALTRALTTRIPGARFHVPRGGYFVWVRLPEGSAGAGELREAARARNVRFTPGSLCAVERDLDDRIRLSFAFHDEEELDLGVELLAAAIAAS